MSIEDHVVGGVAQPTTLRVPAQAGFLGRGSSVTLIRKWRSHPPDPHHCFYTPAAAIPS
jgi:hypothetical protein